MDSIDLPDIDSSAFSDLPLNPAQHLRMALFGVIARVIESCADGSIAAALQAHPFLADYIEELHLRSGAKDALARRWWKLVCDWEKAAVKRGMHLPLVALRDAGLSALELELLLAVGLVEEDPRFGNVFEAAQRNERRPTFGLLMAWWRDDEGGEDRADAVRTGLQRLIDLGLLQLSNADAPRADWAPAPVLPVWDGLRGEPPTLRWLQFRPIHTLEPLQDHVASDTVCRAFASLPELLVSRPPPVLLVRGPVHNGRKTLAGALAREIGKSALIVNDAVFEDETRWRLLGVLSAMTNAVPIVELELAPGESRTLPAMPLADVPLIVITGRHGAWASAASRPMLAIDLPMPDASQRELHWNVALQGRAPKEFVERAAHVRLASGNIRTVASSACGLAKLAGRDSPGDEDLRRASRMLQSARLETLATRLESRGALNDLSVDDHTREELSALVSRCRWREVLAADLAAVAMGSIGVRALFAGPSGTGKTLAARLLAAELGKDLYRVDLAATVNKYLGETEKNLNQVLNAAEELDVVLLLDEGDALMANRTDVASSNDRYANLETNFLLQRVESFEGILLVTTNAADRIDRAFARRMDVVVNFRTPDEWQRYGILSLHLGNSHAIDDTWLQDAARRCSLSGGQWRNVATQARLLALEDGHDMTADHLYAALTREYRKTGGLCPLRPMQAG